MPANRIVIVSPATRDANNGNWQTARRWQQQLAARYQARVVRQWPDTAASTRDGALLALHARHSAASVAAWAARTQAMDSAPGLAVVLTGTDLYRDLQTDLEAQTSLRLARHLVTLQACGPDALPARLRAKARVIYQSTTPRRAVNKTNRHLRVVVVGHLRDEKAPDTVFALARVLSGRDDIRIDHIGAALEPALGRMAQQTAIACPAYRWLDGQPHEATRRWIQRAHVLLHPSRMEGGAHVVMEAVCSGTVVLASHVDGNVGMLGRGYSGYFGLGNVAAAADLLLRCRNGQAGAGADLLGQLVVQCQRRSHLFDTATERVQLHQLAAELLAQEPRPS